MRPLILTLALICVTFVAIGAALSAELAPVQFPTFTETRDA